MEEVKVSLYKNVKDTTGKEESLFEVLNAIKSGSWKLAKHQKEVREGKADKANTLAITPSGIFSRRSDRSLIHHNGFLNFDIDHVEDLQAVFDTVSGDPHCFAIWRSISGEGITGLFHVDKKLNARTHKTVYENMIAYFKEMYGIELDEKCKNASRLRFLSFDENLQMYADAKPFFWKPQKAAKTVNKQQTIAPAYNKQNKYITAYNNENRCEDLLINNGWKEAGKTKDGVRYCRPGRSKGSHGEVFTDNRFNCYTSEEGLEKLGNRVSPFDIFMHYEHNGDFEAAKNAIRPAFTEDYKPAEPRDIPPPIAIPDYLLEGDHQPALNGVDHPNINDTQKSDIGGILESVPLIDESIFDSSNVNSLPKPICNYLASYEGRDRDLMLISLLGILSGLFDTVKLKYDKLEVPVLYALIMTTSGLGKGLAKRNEQLVSGINRKRREQSIEDIKAWKIAAKRAQNEKDITFTEEKPPEKKLLSSGNFTAAKLILDLANNKNIIISTTEGDGIATKMKSAFGGEISEIFRKAYHQETVTNETVQNGDLIAEEPILSMSILCTESQVSGIINNVRDGLISRFSFYGHNDPFIFCNQRMKKQNNDYLQKIDKLKNLIERLHASDYELIIDFTEAQDHIINELGLSLQQRVKVIPDQDTNQLVTRGIVQFLRICAVLTNLRRLEEIENGCYPMKGIVFCSTSDFETAQVIWKPIIECNLKMFAALSEVAIKAGTEAVKATESSGMFSLIDVLDDSFTTQNAIRKGSLMEISKRSVQRYLKEWSKNGLITKVSHGVYQKTTKS